MLHNLQFGLCRVSLTALQDTSLPPDEHLGPLLHDQFGAALKHTVCPFPNGPCQERCLVPRGGCVYTRLFETTRESVPPTSWQGQNLYRPFALEPPLHQPRRFAAGDMLTFNLVLVGEALPLFPFFVAALEGMARFGFGLNAWEERAPWQVTRICRIEGSGAADGETLYVAGQPDAPSLLQPKAWDTLVAESDRMRVDQVTLEIVTPLRLEGLLLPRPDEGEEKRYEVDMSVLGRALLRRLCGLSELWCHSPLPLDHRALLDYWCRSVSGHAEYAWPERWKRHSVRQNADLGFTGWCGRLILEGDLSDLRVFLTLGEHLHLGKQTVLGLGKYLCR